MSDGARRRYTVRPVVTPLPSKAAGNAGGAPGCLQATGAASPAHRDAAEAGKPEGGRDPFLRAATEDDDGYDPFSDRPPAPEPTFQEDPWR